MKKKMNSNLNDDKLNEDNTNNLFLPPTKKIINNNDSNIQYNELIKEKKKNLLGLSKKKRNNTNNNIINELTKNNSIKNSSGNLEKVDVTNSNSQTKPKKLKNKKNKNKTENELNSIDNNTNRPKIQITSIIINEVNNRYVPKFSKKKKKIEPVNIFCIYRRKVYPYIFNVNSKIKDIYMKLSEELNVEKNSLEFRINERIMRHSEEEKLIKELINEEKTDKIYVNKLYHNYNMINNLYNKSYNNLVIIENSFEIEEIEKKLNKFLEEYHIEKDYYFKKISDIKYSFGFSCPDFAFDFNRLLLILKRTEKDFKDIKSYLRLEKKKKKTNFPFLELLTDQKGKNKRIKMPSISLERIK